MKIISVLFISLMMIGPVDAAMLKYKDDSGKTWYVNRIESVPERYRDQLGQKVSVPVAVDDRVHASRLASREPGSIDPSQLANIEVEIFVATNCVKCIILENFLNAHKIAFLKYDIDADPAGKELYDQLGITEIPATRVGSRVIEGFLPSEILSAIKK